MNSIGPLPVDGNQVDTIEGAAFSQMEIQQQSEQQEATVSTITEAPVVDIHPVIMGEHVCRDEKGVVVQVQALEESLPSTWIRQWRFSAAPIIDDGGGVSKPANIIISSRPSLPVGVPDTSIFLQRFHDRVVIGISQLPSGHVGHWLLCQVITTDLSSHHHCPRPIIAISNDVEEEDEMDSGGRDEENASSARGSRPQLDLEITPLLGTGAQDPMGVLLGRHMTERLYDLAVAAAQPPLSVVMLGWSLDRARPTNDLLGMIGWMVEAVGELYQEVLLTANQPIHESR